MTPVLQARGLAKRYRIGEEARYRTLRETIVEGVRTSVRLATAFGRSRRSRNGTAPESELWALRDVNLDVVPGEVLGIIGANGAGKSTLLKILSRITKPTCGRVETHGQV